MIKFDKYDDALEKANEISKDKLKSISIVKRCNGTDFIVCDGNVSEDRKSHDQFIMLVTNFESPFSVHYTSPKSGKHIDSFPTWKQADTHYKELVKGKYYKDIFRILTPKHLKNNYELTFHFGNNKHVLILEDFNSENDAKINFESFMRKKYPKFELNDWNPVFKLIKRS